MVDLETIIVIIIERDGKVKQMWFEKRSGNAPYDQNAMRAIKKAEPLPALPMELSENVLEAGIRFRPEKSER
jgi:colicin import membrane protein